MGNDVKEEDQSLENIENVNVTKHDEVRKKYKFFCDQCDYGCVRKQRLLQHIEMKHNIKDEYPCDLCSVITKRELKNLLITFNLRS